MAVGEGGAEEEAQLVGGCERTVLLVRKGDVGRVCSSPRTVKARTITWCSRMH